MTRTTEAGLLTGAAVIAAFGIVLVNLAGDETINAQVGLSFLTFLLAFAGIHFAIRLWAPSATPLLLPPAALLSAIGMVMIYRLDPERASLQRWWLLIAAAAAALLLALIHERGVALFRRYRNLVLLSTVVLLLLPNLPAGGPLPIKGLEVNESRLWILIDMGFTQLQFQPAEVAKLGFVLFLAAYLADHQNALVSAQRKLGPISFPEPRELLPLALVWAGSVFILVAQRDLGASVLLFGTFVLLLYAATGGIGYLVGGGLLTLLGGLAAWRLFGHVQTRITAWLDPWSDLDGAGYQTIQGLFAMGSGSIAGAGPGLGRPDLIPVADTDLIFAAIGEELGFAGSVAILCAFALLISVGFGVSLRSRDRFRKLTAAGITVLLAVQTFLIIGGVVRVVPLTGITLPFVSYGGSALVGNFIMLAVLARISDEEQQ
ncbi:MAG: hypothetical protein GEU79_01940 [Acidimicrobiia bacterium]|nr:hypothetical protein [Acidimicrobiia bacterium]